MTALEREIEIIRLQDQKTMLGMVNIAQLTYEQRVVSLAQYRLDIKEIDRKIRQLQNAGE